MGHEKKPGRPRRTRLALSLAAALIALVVVSILISAGVRRLAGEPVGTDAGPSTDSVSRSDESRAGAAQRSQPASVAPEPLETSAHVESDSETAGDWESAVTGAVRNLSAAVLRDEFRSEAATTELLEIIRSTVESSGEEAVTTVLGWEFDTSLNIRPQLSGLRGVEAALNSVMTSQLRTQYAPLMQQLVRWHDFWLERLTFEYLSDNLRRSGFNWIEFDRSLETFERATGLGDYGRPQQSQGPGAESEEQQLSGLCAHRLHWGEESDWLRFLRDECALLSWKDRRLEFEVLAIVGRDAEGLEECPGNCQSVRMEYRSGQEAGGARVRRAYDSGDLAVYLPCASGDTCVLLDRGPITGSNAAESEQLIPSVFRPSDGTVRHDHLSFEINLMSWLQYGLTVRIRHGDDQAETTIPAARPNSTSGKANLHEDYLGEFGSGEGIRGHVCSDLLDGLESRRGNCRVTVCVRRGEYAGSPSFENFAYGALADDHGCVPPNMWWEEEDWMQDVREDAWQMRIRLNTVFEPPCLLLRAAGVDHEPGSCGP